MKRFYRRSILSITPTRLLTSMVTDLIWNVSVNIIWGDLVMTVCKRIREHTHSSVSSSLVICICYYCDKWKAQHVESGSASSGSGSGSGSGVQEDTMSEACQSSSTTVACFFRNYCVRSEFDCFTLLMFWLDSSWTTRCLFQRTVCLLFPLNQPLRPLQV